MTECLIGRGNGGEVMKVGDQTPFIAVKYAWINPAINRKSLKREFKVSRKLDHPNIVKYYGMNEITRNHSPHFVIYMEFCEKKSLTSVIEDPTITYTMRTVFEWAEHLALALVYLKEHKVLHRDLKPDNVLVTEGFVLKLGDFGLCKDLNGNSSMSRVGTNRYMAPEASGALGPAKTIYKSDLYALGLIVFEILERRVVFSPTYDEHGFNQDALFYDLKRKEVDVFHFSTDCNPVLQDIVLWCTRFESNERPEADDVLETISKNKNQFDKERFEPMIEPGRREVQKPTCFFTKIAKDDPDSNQDSSGIKKLNPDKPSDAIHSYKAYFGDEKQILSPLKTLSDAVSHLKTLGDVVSHLKMLAHQCDTELFTKIENRIRECLIIPQGYIFFVDEYPEFLPFLDQELGPLLRQKKYQSVFKNISSVAEKWIRFVKKEFRDFVYAYLETFDTVQVCQNNPNIDSLMKAYKECYRIIRKTSGNFFFSQYFKFIWYDVHSTKIALLSKKKNLFFDIFNGKSTVHERIFMTVDSPLFLDGIIVRPGYHNGFHLETWFDFYRKTIETRVSKDFTETLKRFSFKQRSSIQDSLKIFQLPKRVFPYTAYIYNPKESVIQNEVMKAADIDRQSLLDYETLCQTFEWSFRLMEMYNAKRDSMTKEEANLFIKQLQDCIAALKQKCMCPNFFKFPVKCVQENDFKKELGSALFIKENLMGYMGIDRVYRSSDADSRYGFSTGLIDSDDLVTALSGILNSCTNNMSNKKKCVQM